MTGAELKADPLNGLHAVEERLDEATEHENESALLAVEQCVFWTAFVVRKLVESCKLTDEFEKSAWAVETFPKRSDAPPVDFLNWHHIDRHYDFAAPTRARLSLRTLCDQLIHSFVFMPETTEDEKTVTALHFNSDRTKDKLIHRLPWDEFRRLVGDLAEDYIVDLQFDRRTGKVAKPALRARRRSSVILEHRPVCTAPWAAGHTACDALEDGAAATSTFTTRSRLTIAPLASVR